MNEHRGNLSEASVSRRGPAVRTVLWHSVHTLPTESAHGHAKQALLQLLAMLFAMLTHSLLHCVKVLFRAAHLVMPYPVMHAFTAKQTL